MSMDSGSGVNQTNFNESLKAIKVSFEIKIDRAEEDHTKAIAALVAKSENEIRSLTRDLQSVQASILATLDAEEAKKEVLPESVQRKLKFYEDKKSRIAAEIEDLEKQFEADKDYTIKQYEADKDYMTKQYEGDKDRMLKWKMEQDRTKRIKLTHVTNSSPSSGFELLWY